MYGIFTYNYHKDQVNVGKYRIHFSYGTWEQTSVDKFQNMPDRSFPYCRSLNMVRFYRVFVDAAGKLEETCRRQEQDILHLKRALKEREEGPVHMEFSQHIGKGFFLGAPNHFPYEGLVQQFGAIADVV